MAAQHQIGIMAVIVDNREQLVPAVQDVLTEHGEKIIGRMGIPHRPRGLHIITVVVEGTAAELNALQRDLQQVDGVWVGGARIPL